MMKIIYLFVLISFINFNNAEKSLQCGDWEVFKDEKCYKVLENVFLTYEKAINICYQNEGSSLVSIRSKEEQDFLFNLLHNIHKNENAVVCQKTQSWLYSYLQKTVMQMRESINNLTQQLEFTQKNSKTFIDNLTRDFEITKNELQNTKLYLEEEIRKKSIESTPLGTIAYFSDTSVPIGWLKANGQSVSRTSYTNLFATIGTRFGFGDGSTTFTLPDLRGEFIRGWSDGRDVDNERTFGSFQWGSSIPYVTYIDYKSSISSSTGFWQHRAFAGKTFDGGFQGDISMNQTRNGMTFDGYNNLITTLYNDATISGSITGWSVLQGTRARNIALLACVKY